MLKQRSSEASLIVKNIIHLKSIKDKGNTKRGISPCLKIRPCDLDLWPWKSIGFQILLRTKYLYVPSLVKIHWRMLILECSQGCYAVKKLTRWNLVKLGTYLDLKRIWNLIDFQGHRSRSPDQIFRRGDMPRFVLPLFIN
jgi:hypothetical protein